MLFAKQFYAILRQACEKRGAQQELVSASGIGQPALSRILSGKTKDPGLESVSALIDALGYSLCRNGKGGESISLQLELEEAQAKIKQLEEELARSRGEVRGLQNAFESVLAIITPDGKKFLDANSPLADRAIVPDNKLPNK